MKKHSIVFSVKTKKINLAVGSIPQPRIAGVKKADSSGGPTPSATVLDRPVTCELLRKWRCWQVTPSAENFNRFLFPPDMNGMVRLLSLQTFSHCPRSTSRANRQIRRAGDSSQGWGGLTVCRQPVIQGGQPLVTWLTGGPLERSPSRLLIRTCTNIYISVYIYLYWYLFVSCLYLWSGAANSRGGGS